MSNIILCYYIWHKPKNFGSFLRVKFLYPLTHFSPLIPSYFMLTPSYLYPHYPSFSPRTICITMHIPACFFLTVHISYICVRICYPSYYRYIPLCISLIIVYIPLITACISLITVSFFNIACPSLIPYIHWFFVYIWFDHCVIVDCLMHSPLACRFYIVYLLI